MLFPLECTRLRFAEPAISYFFGPGDVEFEVTDFTLHVIGYFGCSSYFCFAYLCIEEGRAFASRMPEYHIMMVNM
jgi:hypothetical protein